MVLHFFQRIADPSNFNVFKNHRMDYLLEAGFSREEAENLNYLHSHVYIGKFIGLTTGIFATYCFSPWVGKLAVHFPRLYYQPWVGNICKIASVFVFYRIGDYIFSSRRWGGNYSVSNPFMLNNRNFCTNRENFV